MKLVYETTGKPVQYGDFHFLDGVMFIVEYFAKPTTPGKPGHLTLRYDGTITRTVDTTVNVIGAVWRAATREAA